MNLFSFVIDRMLTVARISLFVAIVVISFIGCGQKIDPAFQQGKEIYQTYCVACHGVNGSGVLYAKSALNNDAFVVGTANKVIAVILYGREGSGTMPGWKMTLTDQEVAAVATYIRQAWSNRADPVTPAMVKEIRAKGERNSFTKLIP